MHLSDYGMSRDRGYLSHYEIDEVALPALLAPAREVAGQLSDLLTSGRVRHWLSRLDDPGLEEWARYAPEAQVRTAMVH